MIRFSLGGSPPKKALALVSDMTTTAQIKTESITADPLHSWSTISDSENNCDDNGSSANAKAAAPAASHDPIDLTE
jgi:hypothetical protein